MTTNTEGPSGFSYLYDETLTVPVDATLRVEWARAELDKRIPGQERVKNAMAMAMALYRAKVRHEYEYMAPPVLCIGTTGSGKTYMAEKMAEIMKIPVKICGMSRVMNTGYKGVGLGYIVKDLWLREHGILWLDEMDKLVAPTNQHHDGFKLAMQHELLDILGGAEVQLSADDAKFEFNSSRYMICMSGAFSGLDAIIRRRLGRAPTRRAVGFAATQPQSGASACLSEAEVLQLVEPEDLVEYGMLPELVGRIHDIVVFDPLGEEDYYHMFDSAAEGILGKYTSLFLEHGTVLKWSDDAKRACARMAAARGLGYRGLQQILHTVCSWVMYGVRQPVVMVTGAMVSAACTRGARSTAVRSA